MRKQPSVENTSSYIVKLVIVAVIAAVLVVTISLVELYTQLARYSAYWDRNNATALRSDAEITYVAFGDSAAQGVGATRPDYGYVGRIAKEIEADSGKSVRVINLSKSGAKIADVIKTQLPRYNDLDLTDRPIITIEIGANDILTFNASQFETEMDTLMQQLPKQTIMSDIPYFGKTRYGKLQPQAEKANEIIYRLSAKHGIEVASLHDKVEANGGLRTMAIDIFHPSNKGYRENWAPAFLEKIQQ